MGKTYYKHRPDDEREHVKNASRTHGHAKYRKMREVEEQVKKPKLLHDWIDDPDFDDPFIP
jgi:hypothetical protein